MRTDLVALDSFPTTQPYSGYPWDYPGMESITNKPTNVVDWVLVELRKPNDTIIDLRAGLLLEDGQVVDTNLTAGLTFNHFDAGE